MKPLVFIFQIHLFILNVCTSQVHSFSFPQYCDFISQPNQGPLLLGSNEGLYTFDGKSLDAIPFDLSVGNNVQSTFFEENDHTVWFSTYSKIVHLDLTNYFTTEYSIINSGDTIKSDYHGFYFNSDRHLLLTLAGSAIFTFNTLDHQSKVILKNVSDRRFLSFSTADTLFLAGFFYTSNPTICKFSFSSQKIISSAHWIDWPAKTIAWDMLKWNDDEVLIATSRGLYIGNVHSRQIQKINIPGYSDQAILCMNMMDKDNILVMGKTTGLFGIEKNSLLYSPVTFSLPYGDLPNKVNRIITLNDGTVFLSTYEDSIRYFNPKKLKFSNLTNNNVNDRSLLRDLMKNDTIKDLFNDEGMQDSIRMAANTDFTIKSFTPFLFSTSYAESGEPIHRFESPRDTNLYKFFKGPQYQIYASYLDGELYEQQKEEMILVPHPDVGKKTINFYYPLNDSFHILSANDEMLLLWNPTNYLEPIKKINLSADIFNAVYSIDLNTVAMSTTTGLVLLKCDNLTHEILHSHNSSNCYCVLKDRSDRFWYSSSDGIQVYDPKTQDTQHFTESDGVSSSKYRQGKCISYSPDSLFFFHVNGITIVRPSQNQPIESSATVLISDLKINDELAAAPQELNYVSSFTTIYRNNTISFLIQAIDWSDPSSGKIKYKLEGYDQNWIMVNATEAPVRYPRLPPGHYTFYAQAANSDDVWNTQIKKIAISVVPPIYMRWWFVMLSFLFLVGFIYWIIRSEYQRRLEKKNLLLRQQTLIIEKQQAVEHERTRIASEMHDDLGSGLTTIRYLSSKALFHSKDHEESAQIEKIAAHSNELIRNMSEIIWAMNSRFDNTQNLTGYLRRYASEFLEQHLMPFSINTEASMAEVTIGGEKRRNLFLVFKEVLHNAVKYSGARKIVIEIQTNTQFIIKIIEQGGVGFDPEISFDKGNGLFNCRKRMETIHGEITFEKSGDNMETTISTSLNQIASETN